MTDLTPMIALFTASCVLSLVFTGLTREIAFRIKLLDHPDGQRKMHARPTPVGGGLAILAAGVVTLTVAVAAGGFRGMLTSDSDAHYLTGLLIAALMICALGVA